MAPDFSKFDLPPASKLLGFELLNACTQTGSVDVAFLATDQMLNPMGHVQGGFVAAMLDDTMGPAMLAISRGEEVAFSIGMNVQFLRPVKPGRILGKGGVIRRGGKVVSLRASLLDEAGEELDRKSVV